MSNLDSWFDYQSKRLDEMEKAYGLDLVTGKKNKPSNLIKKSKWSKLFDIID
jgi:hypothetical protein